MRLLATILLVTSAAGQAPPPASNAAQKEYLEARATLLRQVTELKAKLLALELELQILDEARASDPASPPPPTAWRDETAAPEGTAKKVTVRCLSVTRGGKRCTRPAEPGAKFCWQHRHH